MTNLSTITGAFIEGDKVTVEYKTNKGVKKKFVGYPKKAATMRDTAINLVVEEGYNPKSFTGWRSIPLHAEAPVK